MQTLLRMSPLSLTHGLLSLLLLAPLSGQGPDIPSGLWSGGYGVLGGNTPEWYTIIADLEVDGSRIQGALRRGGRIQGQIEDEVVILSIQQQGRRLRCETRLEDGVLVGTCTGGSQPYELQLLFEPDPGALPDFVGTYEEQSGGRVAITQSIHLRLTDFQTGADRVLYAAGTNRFVAGESYAVPLPIDLQLSFERDDSGAVSGVSIATADSVRRLTRGSPCEVEEFTFVNDGVTLAGSLFLPPGAGPHPVAVFVHGSGPQGRDGAGTWPAFLVAEGFAVLAYDKRGQGGSGGSYTLPSGGRDNQPHMRRRSTDVLAAVRALKTRNDIDGDQVGLIGVSQAGWVMPMVAETGEVAFTITLSGGATELSIEGLFSTWADEGGWGGTPVEELVARLREYEPRDYDFRPHFRAQKVPGLWLYGGKDRSNPSILCIEMIEQIRQETGNDFTTRLFPDGNHGLRVANTGGAAESLVLKGLVPGLHQVISDWLEQKGIGPR